MSARVSHPVSWSMMALPVSTPWRFPMTTVTLYSQPGCGPCVAVKSHLARAGVTVTVRDVTADEDAAATVRALGYTGTPVVVAGDMHTHGYRRDWLNQLVAAIRAEEADQDGHVDGLLAAVEVAA